MQRLGDLILTQTPVVTRRNVESDFSASAFGSDRRKQDYQSTHLSLTVTSAVLPPPPPKLALLQVSKYVVYI